MIANIWAEDSTAARCLALIERHAPRLMIAGGGALEGARCDGIYRRMTDEQREDALRMARTGDYSATEIARAIGSTQSAVRSFLVRSGIQPALCLKNGSRKP